MKRGWIAWSARVMIIWPQMGGLKPIEREELMTRYDGKTFEGQHLVLDEGIFINCVFKNCSLEYSGGDVYVQNCQGDGCQLIWRGPAQKTVFLLQGLGLMPPPPTPPGGATPGRVQ